MEPWTVRTLAEAEVVAEALSRFCPEPSLALVGLRELLVNAVEHGCLGITHQEKTRLLAEGAEAWEDEVARRLDWPENVAKRVTVQVDQGAEEVRFLIRDPGPGFDWEPFLRIQPGRLADQHGRGIAMAREMSFHRLEYRGVGNEVLAVVRLAPATEV